MPDPVTPIIPPSAPRNPLSALGELPQADGRTTIDATARIDIDLLAYDTLSDLFDGLAERLRAEVLQGGRIVCIDTPFARALEYYDALPGQIAVLRAGFARVEAMAKEELAQLEPQVVSPAAAAEREVKPESMALPSPITAAVAGAVSFLGAIRQQVEITGRELTIDPIALVALAMDRLSARLEGVDVLAPSIALPPLCRSAAADAETDAPDIIAALQLLFGSRDRARRTLLRLAGSVQQLAADDPRRVEMRASLDSIREQFDAIDGALTDIETDLTSGAGKGEHSLLQLVRRAERLCVSLHTGNPSRTYLLRLHLVTAGGMYRIVTHALRSLFSGDGLACAAAVIVAWTLSDASTGEIVATGVERRRLTRASLYRDVDRTEAWRALGGFVAIGAVMLLAYYVWQRVRSGA